MHPASLGPFGYSRSSVFDAGFIDESDGIVSSIALCGLSAFYDIALLPLHFGVVQGWMRAEMVDNRELDMREKENRKGVWLRYLYIDACCPVLTPN